MTFSSFLSFSVRRLARFTEADANAWQTLQSDGAIVSAHRTRTCKSCDKCYSAYRSMSAASRWQLNADTFYIQTLARPSRRSPQLRPTHHLDLETVADAFLSPSSHITPARRADYD